MENLNYQLEPLTEEKKPIPKITYFTVSFLLLGWPLISLLMMSGDSAQNHSFKSLSYQIYLPTIITEWLLFFLILLTVKKERISLTQIGFRQFNLKNLLIGFGFVILSNIILVGVAFVVKSFGILPQKDISFLLPKSISERLFWIFMSASAALSEETCFRGYLLTKLNLWIRNSWLIVILSSLSFGMGHLYQGLGGVILTSVYGLFFAMLFLWRRSLTPCIFAHFIQDSSVVWLQWQM